MPECGGKVEMFPPVARLQSLTEPFQAPVAREAPSGEKETERRLIIPALMILDSVPVAASHSLTVPSEDAEATVVPSGEKDTDSTCPL